LFDRLKRFFGRGPVAVHGHGRRDIRQRPWLRTVGGGAAAGLVAITALGAGASEARAQADSAVDAAVDAHVQRAALAHLSAHSERLETLQGLLEGAIPDRTVVFIDRDLISKQIFLQARTGDPATPAEVVAHEVERRLPSGRLGADDYRAIARYMADESDSARLMARRVHGAVSGDPELATVIIPQDPDATLTEHLHAMTGRKAENIRTVGDIPGEIALTIEQTRAFSLFHEFGHALDLGEQPGGDFGNRRLEREYRRHRQEVLADVFAVIATAREGRGNIAPAYTQIRNAGLGLRTAYAAGTDSRTELQRPGGPITNMVYDTGPALAAAGEAIDRLQASGELSRMTAGDILELSQRIEAGHAHRPAHFYDLWVWNLDESAHIDRLRAQFEQGDEEQRAQARARLTFLNQVGTRVAAAFRRLGSGELSDPGRILPENIDPGRARDLREEMREGLTRMANRRGGDLEAWSKTFAVNRDGIRNYLDHGTEQEAVNGRALDEMDAWLRGEAFGDEPDSGPGVDIPGLGRNHPRLAGPDRTRQPPAPPPPSKPREP